MTKEKKRIYLDYAATTPVDPIVLRAMEPYFTGVGARGSGGKFGNPGSLHSFGQEAIAAVDHARETIARAIGAEFREIIFTSSATEANNLVLRGVVEKWRTVSRDNKETKPKAPRIIISAIEHESVLETARELEREGVEVVYIPVDKSGIIDVKKIKTSLDERTVLVSVMYANNEIGTIQPIVEIGKIIEEYKRLNNIKKIGKANENYGVYPKFHTDAAQAFQFLNCNVAELGVDLMTLSSHKIYGPKGAAALYIQNERSGGKNNVSNKIINPLIVGGGQEYGLRSGTENVPAIVGFAKAIELAGAARAKESKRIAALSDQLWCGIKTIYPKAEMNGRNESEKKKGEGDEQKTLPNILNIYFPNRAAQDLLTRFDLAGSAVSSGSACRSRAFESSYVIEALGYSKERAKASIRFSLGKPTQTGDIDKILKTIYTVFGGSHEQKTAKSSFLA